MSEYRDMHEEIERLKAESMKLREENEQQRQHHDECVDIFRLAQAAHIDHLREALEKFIPVKDVGPWAHGYGCPAEGYEGSENVNCLCGQWEAIDQARTLLSSTPESFLEEVRRLREVYEAAIKWYHETDGFDSQALSDVIAAHQKRGK